MSNGSDPYPNYPSESEYMAGLQNWLDEIASNPESSPADAVIAQMIQRVLDGEVPSGPGPPMPPTVQTGYYPINDSPYPGLNPDDCRSIAQTYGLFAWDPVNLICEPVFGKTIPIWPDVASIQEGFELVNFNFRVNGTAPPVPTPAGLPGIVKGWVEPGHGTAVA